MTTLLGRAGAVAGDVEFRDDGVMHDPVTGRRGGHVPGDAQVSGNPPDGAARSFLHLR